MRQRGSWRSWSGRSGSAGSRTARLPLPGLALLLLAVTGGADSGSTAGPPPPPAAGSPAGQPGGWQAGQPGGWQPDGRQAGQPDGWQTGQPGGWQTGQPGGWQTGQPGGWQAGQSGDWPGAAAAGCVTGCPPSTTATGTRPVAGTESLPAPASTGTSDGPPTRVRIPRIKVDSSLATLGLDRSGKLAAPTDYGQAGWFGAGTAPGDTGPAVIAGHVDSTSGPAVFYRLRELRPGDRIEVRRGTRWLPFVVVSTSRHDKDEFPTAEVYGPTPGPELRLVTCAGSFDPHAGSYRDNLVVFAVAV
ncbi:class F sortase [Micromonospora sp. NPDC050397]|uniref:class F sortase n=1 Tax=Micromonospora sp. NPDC050397 TaxID=3364279 RepID=UPI0038512E2B